MKINSKNHRGLPRHQAGFSILELLIYMGVSAFLLGSLTQIFVLISRLRLDTQASSELQQDGMFLLSRMSYDLARSGTITTPALGSQGAILQTDMIKYSLDANNHIQITDLSGSDMISGYDTTVSGLNFLHLKSGSKDNVQVSFTLTSKVVKAGGSQTKQFITTIGTR